MENCRPRYETYNEKMVIIGKWTQQGNSDSEWDRTTECLVLIKLIQLGCYSPSDNIKFILNKMSAFHSINLLHDLGIVIIQPERTHYNAIRVA